MTRDELIEIIENEVYIEDNYGSYHEIAGVSDAADAILAKLEQEQNVGYVLLTEISYGERM